MGGPNARLLLIVVCLLCTSCYRYEQHILELDDNKFANCEHPETITQEDYEDFSEWLELVRKRASHAVVADGEKP